MFFKLPAAHLVIFHVTCFCLFHTEDAVFEAENLIRSVLEEVSDPAMGGGTTCTPSVLLERTKMCLDVIDSTTANFSLYSNDSSGTVRERGLV